MIDMKMILLDVKNEVVEIVEADGLQDYYRHIGTDVIDIVTRRIGGEPYEIICDDEGLLKEYPKISAIDDMGQPMLVGNLLIAGGVDIEGNLEPVEIEDIEYVMQFIQTMYTRSYPEGYKMLTQVSY